MNLNNQVYSFFFHFREYDGFTPSLSTISSVNLDVSQVVSIWNSQKDSLNLVNRLREPIRNLLEPLVMLWQAVSELRLSYSRALQTHLFFEG